MALFCAAIRRDSVFLLRFPFRRHIEVFSCDIWPVCHLKYPYSYFSSHFYFLVIVVLFVPILSLLLLAAVICLSLPFLMLSSSTRIDAFTLSLMLASLLPPSFFDIYSLSMSSLGCKVLCIINFLILWSDFSSPF